VFLCWKFWLALFRYLILHSTQNNSSFFLAYLHALVNTVRPKVIVTGADNNATLASLAEISPDVWFIFVQTALRDTSHGFPHGISLPTYYALGQRERLIFASLEVRCRQYVPTGSIKLGHALSDPAPPAFASTDLCFISDHRAEQPVITLPPLVQTIEATNDLLFMHSCEYAKKNDLFLRVVAKSREPNWQEKERLHYQKLYEDCPLDFVTADKSTRELDTYHALLASGLVIHNASTLGFEALAAEKKVLFGASMNPQLVRNWGISAYFDQVPDFMCLQQKDFSHFEQKLDALRGMSLDEYRCHTSAAAQQLISQDTNCPPHEHIREAIRQYLLN
ncbi:MAG: hypothetical protein QGG67_18220, partial [Gammaproteobacteria bacterium]|nr:hypothetical protein [Gammaproteobacteria bacterium]